MNGYIENNIFVTNSNNVAQKRTNYFIERSNVLAIGSSKYTIRSSDECLTCHVKSLRKTTIVYDMNKQPQFKFKFNNGLTEKELLISGPEENDEVMTIPIINNSSLKTARYNIVFMNKATNTKETLVVVFNFGSTLVSIYCGSEHGALIGKIKKSSMINMNFELEISPGIDKYFMIGLAFCMDKLIQNRKWLAV